jgi:hypothetical protein
MKRKSQRKKMAEGGVADPEPTPSPSPAPIDPDKAESAQKSMRQAFGYAEGGGVKGGEMHHGGCQCPGCCEKMAEGGQITDNYQSPSTRMHQTKDGDVNHREMDSGYMMHEGNVQRPNSMAMSEDGKRLNQHPVDMHAETSMEEQDLVDRIMEKRSMDYSGLDRYAEGGKVDSPNWGAKGWQHEKDYNEGVHREVSSGGKSYTGELVRKGQTDRAINRQKSQMAHNKMSPNPKLQGLSEGGRVANQDEIEAGFSPNEFDDLHLRDDLESSYSDDDNAGDALGNKQEDEDRRDIVARIMASRRKKDRLPNPA